MPLLVPKPTRFPSIEAWFGEALLDAGAPGSVRTLWSALAERVGLLGPGRAFDAMNSHLEPALDLKSEAGSEAFKWLWDTVLVELTSRSDEPNILLDGSLALLCGCQAFAGAGARRCGVWLSDARARAQQPLRGAAAPDPAVWPQCPSLAQRLAVNGGSAMNTTRGAVAQALEGILAHTENREMGWEAKRALKAFLAALGAGGTGRSRAMCFGGFLGAPALTEVAPGGLFRVLAFQPRRILRMAPNQPGLLEGWQPRVAMWVQAALRHVLRGEEPVEPYRPGIYPEAWAKLRLETLVYALSCAGSGVALDDWIESPDESVRGARTAARFLLWSVPARHAKQALKTGKSPFGHLLGLEDPWGDYGRWRSMGGSLHPLADGTLHRGLAHHAWQALEEGPK